MEIKRIITGCSFLICLFLTSCGLREDLAPVEEAFLTQKPPNLLHNSFNSNAKPLIKADKNHPEPIKNSQLTKKTQDNKEKKVIKPMSERKTDNKSKKNVIIDKTTNNNKNKLTKESTNISKPKKLSSEKKTIAKNSLNNSNKNIKLPKKLNNTWNWPTRTHDIAVNFMPEKGRKGINIKGSKGNKIYASKDGIVQYAGNGLPSYGNLIIIKHNNQYLTAYGNNLRNLVKEGDKVKAGQIIAEMGVIDRKYWGLHFEVRKAGKPLNPLDFLGAVKPT